MNRNKGGRKPGLNKEYYAEKEKEYLAIATIYDSPRKLAKKLNVGKDKIIDWEKKNNMAEKWLTNWQEGRPKRRVLEREAVFKRVLKTGDPKGAMFLAQVEDGYRAGADVRVGGGVEILTAEYIAAVEEAAEEKLKNNGIS